MLPLPEEEFQRGAVKELQAFDDFRVRILPVLGPLPAIFGLNIAIYILLDLAGKPLKDGLEVKNRRKLYDQLMRGLSEREMKLKGAQIQDKSPITSDDMGYIFEELYSGRSTIPPRVVLPKPYAIRWDPSRGISEDNVVIMGSANAEKHEKECLRGGKRPEEVWDKETVEFVATKSEEMRRAMKIRRG